MVKGLKITPPKDSLRYLKEMPRKGLCNKCVGIGILAGAGHCNGEEMGCGCECGKDSLRGTLHAIVAGLVLNGYLQGKQDKNVDDSVLEFAVDKLLQLFEKELDKARTEWIKNKKGEINENN